MAAALQFPLGHPAVDSVIPGSKTIKETENNIAMMQVKISNEFWRDLKAEKLIPHEAPTPSL
jgi:D-threo-aldose 1-dehydrogenase